MPYRPFAFAAIWILALSLPSSAQLAPRTTPAPAPQPPPSPKLLKDEEIAKKLAELEQINKTLDEQKYGYNAKIIRELREAGVTGDKAFGLWLECKKDVDFDQQGKTMTEFSEWKRRQTKDPNRERDAELQLQVQWLAIVLMDANARTDAARNEAVTAATAFLDGLVERIKKSGGQLRGASAGNVLTSVFAKHYKLESTVSRRDGGAYEPGNLDEIYESMIFPYFRSTNQAVNLMAAWKKRIAQQTAIAESYPFREAKDKFMTEKLPELNWGQATELFKLGQEESAAQSMMAIIKANLAHPRSSDWIADMMSLLRREEAEEPNGKPAPAPIERKPDETPAPDETVPEPAAPEPAAPAPPAPAAPPPKGPAGPRGPAPR